MLFFYFQSIYMQGNSSFPRRYSTHSTITLFQNISRIPYHPSHETFVMTNLSYLLREIELNRLEVITNLEQIIAENQYSID